jgi:hypothetical protein
MRAALRPPGGPNGPNPWPARPPLTARCHGPWRPYGAPWPLTGPTLAGLAGRAYDSRMIESGGPAWPASTGPGRCGRKRMRPAASESAAISTTHGAARNGASPGCAPCAPGQSNRQMGDRMLYRIRLRRFRGRVMRGQCVDCGGPRMVEMLRCTACNTRAAAPRRRRTGRRWLTAVLPLSALTAVVLALPAVGAGPGPGPGKPRLCFPASDWDAALASRPCVFRLYEDGSAVVCRADGRPLPPRSGAGPQGCRRR